MRSSSVQESAADHSGDEQSHGKRRPARFAYCTRFCRFAPVGKAKDGRRICGSGMVASIGPFRAARGRGSRELSGARFRARPNSRLPTARPCPRSHNAAASVGTAAASGSLASLRVGPATPPECAPAARGRAGSVLCDAGRKGRPAGHPHAPGLQAAPNRIVQSTGATCAAGVGASLEASLRLQNH